MARPRSVGEFQCSRFLVFGAVEFFFGGGCVSYDAVYGKNFVSRFLSWMKSRE